MLNTHVSSNQMEGHIKVSLTTQNLEFSPGLEQLSTLLTHVVTYVPFTPDISAINRMLYF
jgi:hypothetical protein